jgi:hypothetical protein
MGYPITEKSDIYSIGMVLIEMISLEVPYSEIFSQIILKEKIIEGYFPMTLEKIKDIEITKIIKRLIDYDPNLRPIINDTFMENFLKINEKDDNRIIEITKLKKKNKQKNTILKISSSKNLMDNLESINNNNNNDQSSLNNNEKLNKNKKKFNSNSNRQLLLKHVSFNEPLTDYKNVQNFADINSSLNFNLEKEKYKDKKNIINISNQNTLAVKNPNIKMSSNYYNIKDIENSEYKEFNKKIDLIHKKKKALCKCKYEENPYFEESLKINHDNEILKFLEKEKNIQILIKENEKAKINEKITYLYNNINENVTNCNQDFNKYFYKTMGECNNEIKPISIENISNEKLPEKNIDVLYNEQDKDKVKQIRNQEKEKILLHLQLQNNDHDIEKVNYNNNLKKMNINNEIDNNDDIKKTKGRILFLFLF